MPTDYGAKCLAELVGTFFLAGTVGCNILRNNGTWGFASTANVLLALVYAFAPVSRANFNPAVSVSLGLAHKMEGGWKQVGAYCIAQLTGAFLAALMIVVLFTEGIPLQPKPSLVGGAMLVEFLYTFMLCFVVLNVTTDANKQYFGLAIGFVIIAAGYSSSPLGAGCLNPAVAFCLIISSFQGGTWFVLYVLVELLGALLAVALFRVLRPEDWRGIGSPRDATPREHGLRAKLIGECIGTYMLVLTVGLNVLGQSKAAAFSIGAALTCMIFAIGDISGGHFNPAVTAAVYLAGTKMTLIDAFQFVGAQVVGGVLGAFTYAIAYGGQSFPLGPGVGHGWASVGYVEFIFTFMLTNAVLSIAVANRDDVGKFGGFIVGSCVVAGGVAAGVSGGSLNPAVSIGISAVRLMEGGSFWKWIIYSFFEFLGAAFAAVVFRITYEDYFRNYDMQLSPKHGSFV